MTPETIYRKAAAACGFLTPEDIKALAESDSTRLEPLLVRCDQGRFTAPAQDVAGLIEAVRKGGWSIRDVSLPAGHRAFARYGMGRQGV